MLRSICKQHFLLNNVKQTKFYSISSNIKKLEPEMNFVKLIGTIGTIPYTTPKGNLKFKVIQTNNINLQAVSFYHEVLVTPSVQNTVESSRLCEGQRININGLIMPKQFVTKDGKIRQSILIVAEELSEPNYNTVVYEDECTVMMTAHIDSVIQNHDTFSMFNLVTHHPSRDENYEYVKYLYSVLVLDDAKREFVRNRLQRYDQVFVQGYFSYRMAQDQHGKQQKTGLIVAEELTKTN